MSKLIASVIAYSYIRFSTPEQRQGDSKRRQWEKAVAYCQRKGWTLSDKTYQDLGVSAFRGRNALVGNLGEFLKAITSGAVKPGSVLIVESFDRITRQGIDEGYDLVKSILKAGILIVTLSPEREFDASATKSLSKGALEIQLILERAAEESERKAERVSQAQAANLEAARKGEKALARRLPAWVERRDDGKLHHIADRAAAVRRIFELARAGLGAKLILRKLKEEGVAPFGSSGRWTSSFVSLLLRDKRVIGQHQPKRKRKPDGTLDGSDNGPALKNAYPAAVPEDLYHAARAGVTKRHDCPGRVAETVNPFSHLLRDARSGAAYITRIRTEPARHKDRKARGDRPRKRDRVLVTTAAKEQGTPIASFPYDTFERAVLSFLGEIDPDDIIGPDKGPDEVAALDGELAGLRGELKQVKADMLARYSSTLADVAAQLEARERELVAKRDAAKQKAAHPAREAMAQAKTLSGTLATAPDPQAARLKLRALLRRTIEEMHLLVTSSGTTRIATLQIHFADNGKRRDLSIGYRAPTGNGRKRKVGAWFVFSLTTDSPGDRAGSPDLKDYATDAKVRQRIDQRLAKELPDAEDVLDAEIEVHEALLMLEASPGWQDFCERKDKQTKAGKVSKEEHQAREKVTREWVKFAQFARSGIIE